MLLVHKHVFRIDETQITFEAESLSGAMSLYIDSGYLGQISLIDQFY